MKRCSVLVLIACTALLTVFPTQRSEAFIWMVIKEGIKKVIRAMDIKVQQMQNKTIALQNAQKALENAMSKVKLKEISDWAEKQRKLFDGYYQELWKVKSYIATYQKVRDILRRQAQLVDEYKTAYELLRQDKHFSPDEIKYMYEVYTGILDESVKNIDEIMLVMNSFSTQMSDGKRLELMNAAVERIESNVADLRAFNNQNIKLSLQRSRDETELQAVKRYYGIQ